MSIEDQLRELWAQVLRQESLPPNADFFELGGSSLAAVDLAALVQEKMGIRVDAVEVVIRPKFADLLELLNTRVT